MKKTSTNRRKKLPLLLGALLVISVAAYGTRAYFSDSATQQANIELELGNVEISTSGTDWTHTSMGGNISSSKMSDGIQSYTNVKPGDSFTKAYTIANTGSLDVTVGLKYNGAIFPGGKDLDLNKLQENQINATHPIVGTPFSIAIENFENNLILKAGSGSDSKVEYKVTVIVNSDASNEFNVNAKSKAKSKAKPENKGETLDSVVSNFLGETLTVTAEQVK